MTQAFQIGELCCNSASLTLVLGMNRWIEEMDASMAQKWTCINIECFEYTFPYIFSRFSLPESNFFVVLTKAGTSLSHRQDTLNTGSTYRFQVRKDLNGKGFPFSMQPDKLPCSEESLNHVDPYWRNVNHLFTFFWKVNLNVVIFYLFNFQTRRFRW